MSQYKIVFKSGNIVYVTKAVAKKLHERIIEGTTNFQFFVTDGDEFDICINLSEIELITKFGQDLLLFKE